MDAQTVFKKLQQVGVLNFATVDKNGAPQIRCISAIHYEDDAMYFFTAQGKPFSMELERDGRVQILGHTKDNEMIRASARAVALSGKRLQEVTDILFAARPNLSKLYPGDIKNIGIVFEVKDMVLEYFNLGVHPIFRDFYYLGDAKPVQKGYKINENCIGCGQCVKACPEHCIEAGAPYRIEPTHCLQCGNCYKHCPAKAIDILD